MSRDWHAVLDKGRGAGDGVIRRTYTGRIIRRRDGNIVSGVTGWSLCIWYALLHGETAIFPIPAPGLDPEDIRVEASRCGRFKGRREGPERHVDSVVAQIPNNDSVTDDVELAAANNDPLSFDGDMLCSAARPGLTTKS